MSDFEEYAVHREGLAEVLADLDRPVPYGLTPMDELAAAERGT